MNSFDAEKMANELKGNTFRARAYKRKLALIGIYIIVLAVMAWFLTLVLTYHTR